MNIINQKRTENNMSRKQLGDLIGVSDKTIARYEREECYPPVNYAYRIAAYFNLLVDDLYDFDSKQDEEQK